MTFKPENFELYDPFYKSVIPNKKESTISKYLKTKSIDDIDIEFMVIVPFTAEQFDRVRRIYVNDPYDCKSDIHFPDKISDIDLTHLLEYNPLNYILYKDLATYEDWMKIFMSDDFRLLLPAIMSKSDMQKNIDKALLGEDNSGEPNKYENTMPAYRKALYNSNKQPWYDMLDAIYYEYHIVTIDMYKDGRINYDDIGSYIYLDDNKKTPEMFIEFCRHYNYTASATMLLGYFLPKDHIPKVVELCKFIS